VTVPGTDGWDPDQYNRFATEREQPFFDLAALLERDGSPDVADLGCGDGRLTVALHRTLGARSTLGVDRSPAMIERTRAQGAPGVRFELGDVAGFDRPGDFDVVFANASLQWVPDHPSVLRRWARSLRPGGQLAAQVPANADHPAHLVAAEVAAERLANPPPDAVAENVLSPEAYAAVLDGLGCTSQHVRLQVYVHRLASTADVVEWVKGTTLTRFKQPMGEEGWARFVSAYRARLLARLEERSPYTYFFKRIHFWGRLP
jgi:trans-aconitate 2-methyltransferase